MASALPTARVRRCVPPAPGMIPTPVSGWPNFALSAATIRSGERELQTTTEAPAADRGDERRREGADRVPALDAPPQIDVDRGHPGELRNVGAGRESPLAAAEDERADRGILVELVQRRDERVHQAVRERVQLLRPVQQHDADEAVPLDNYERLFRNASIASFASSLSIESESQSRAWPTVSCQAMSRHQFSCCFA